MIENFIYNDIVLYCKGWYQTPEGDTMLDDLGYLFGKIYAWTPKTEEEIAHFMMRVLDKLWDEQAIKFDSESWIHNFSGFHNEIKRNMRMYNCSFDMAIIWLVHSIFTWWRNVKLLGCYFDDMNAGLHYEMISEMPIKYVHQLQHVLKLCGIEKEIVL